MIMETILSSVPDSYSVRRWAVREWGGVTLAELQHMVFGGETEVEYRRGYRDGWLAMVELVMNAKRIGRMELGELADEHWAGALYRWMKAANIDRLDLAGDMEWPPELPVERRPTAGVGNYRRFEVLKRDGYRCQLCGATQSDGVRLEVDHKLAKAKGGSDDLSNLWTLCWPCNSGKSARDL